MGVYKPAMLGKGLLILDTCSWNGEYATEHESSGQRDSVVSVKAQMLKLYPILVIYQNTYFAVPNKKESMMLDKQTSKSLFQV